MQDVRELRRELDITQIELAGMLGLDQSTISRLETGALALDARTKLALEALRARRVSEQQAAA